MSRVSLGDLNVLPRSRLNLTETTDVSKKPPLTRISHGVVSNPQKLLYVWML